MYPVYKMNNLKWQQHPKYKNVWLKSNGKVRRVLKNGRIKEGYGTLRSDGYRVIEIPGTNKRNVRVHRLVADVFIPKTQEDIELDRDFINHIDENRSNNRVSNLEWCTHKENCNHSAHKNKVLKMVELESLKDIV